jgi:hypothetical protein
VKKVRRLAMAGVLLAGIAVAPSIPMADAAPGGLVCRAAAFGVKTPTNVADASEGEGIFGTVLVGTTVVNSTMTCTGSITGTAIVTGRYTWCPQSTDHDPETNPSQAWRAANHDHATWAEAQAHQTSPAHTHAAPTEFECNGAGAKEIQPEEAAYPGEAPVNVHIVAEATMTGDIWLNTLSQTNAADCDVALEGHAIAPTKLNATVTCGTQVYDGVVTAGFVPILGTAGDAFHAPDPDDEPETCAASEFGQSPECFRSLVFEGVMEVHATA